MPHNAVQCTGASTSTSNDFAEMNLRNRNVGIGVKVDGFGTMHKPLSES